MRKVRYSKRALMIDQPSPSSTKNCPAPRRLVAALPRRLLSGLGSIRFGVALLVLIFIYSSIGSAVPPVRQGALADWLGLEILRFEKTEMQWFSWWPFQLMIGLLCLGMVMVTIRIRLRFINAGVWAIHTGIVILAVSSAVYFASKVEGDAVIFHSRVLVMVPGLSEPAEFVVRPEAQLSVGEGEHAYDIHVADLNPDHIIRGGDSEGKKTTAIWLSITPADGPRFARRLLLGYPELTEDYLIEGTGVVRVSERLAGRKLLDESLQVQLGYDPTKYFYLHDTSAVYARLAPEVEWRQLRVNDMPYYHEHVDDPESVQNVAGAPALPARYLDLPARPPEGEAGLEGVDIRVTGFLPYAEVRPQWRDGGDRLNPMLRYRIRAPRSELTGDLLAHVPGRGRSRLPTGASIEFVWAAAHEVEDLLRQPVPRLIMTIGGSNGQPSMERTIRLSDLQGNEFVPVEGTEYALKLHRHLPANAAGANIPAGVWIQIREPKVEFSRIVLEGRGDGGIDLDDRMNLMSEPAAPELTLQYVDAWEDRLLVVAAPDGGTLETVRTTAEGRLEHRRIQLGEAVSMGSGVEFVAEQLVRNAKEVIRPLIVPRPQRQPGSLVRQSASLVRVEVRHGSWSEQVWLRYHDYAFSDAQRAQPGRFIHAPTEVILPDGRKLELLYSRWRERLPGAVALDRFVLKTYPGGDQPSDYVSRVRFFEDGDWSAITEVRSNQPARHGDYWYFQAQYDPQTQSHTVLGVGNRVAVGWMLAGTCLSIAGMLYAFYFKPVLIRRRKEQHQRFSTGKPDRPQLEPRPEAREAVAHSDVALR